MWRYSEPQGEQKRCLTCAVPITGHSEYGHSSHEMRTVYREWQVDRADRELGKGEPVQ